MGVPYDFPSQALCLERTQIILREAISQCGNSIGVVSVRGVNMRQKRDHIRECKVIIGNFF